ncbi:hypothetical protein LCGC14_0123530 [marine sediment metagenome]|uniref:Uncharacterized protein n=1 Tax=marine sediment metagenome TaxID=412755 RepID=A0A0F9VAB0_9ZZZZ
MVIRNQDIKQKYMTLIIDNMFRLIPFKRKLPRDFLSEK